MKSFKHLFIISALFGLAACSSEEGTLNVPEAPSDEWNVCSMTMESPAPGFDLSESRADAEDWVHNSRVYISFKKSDNTTTYGSALYNASTKSWTLSYNGRLDAETPTDCKVYYFEGGNVSDNALHTVVTPTSATAVYGGTGSYNFKDGNVNLSVTLAPLTSRIRFKRSSTSGNLSGYMRNVQTYSSFDLTTCKFVMTSPLDRTTVKFTNGMEYSDYIYAFQNFTDFPGLEDLKYEMRVYDGKYVYSYELPKKSDFLEIGESGYMNWPTPDFHNGWYSYEYANMKTLFYISSSYSNELVSNDYDVDVHKFDVIRTTIRESSFYPSPKEVNSSFVLKMGDDKVIDMTRTSSYPGIETGSGDYRYIYYVVPSSLPLHISWIASYWFSNSSYNNVAHITF